MKDTGCAIKNYTNVSWFNSACDRCFLMKFGYVIHNAENFFHSESQGSNSKNDRFIKEKRFLQSLHCLCVHNSAIKAQKCTKIRDDVPQLSVKRS